MERTIKHLSELPGRVNVRLATREAAIRFQQMAEDEGFTFRDGVKPTQRDCAEIMAINRDCTINFVGSVGAIAYGAGARRIGNERLIRVDFDKYVAGEEIYIEL